ncbi:hypothetical protein E2C01_077356 [Portunus trituberculatus]|uniref:Uncharacterized protein n=1 Tax=Portunus trituberculatus TaxID=210409 RepID=A0A5B7ILX5_PORTR|nr:hypothetical protein [Portunus trituberculatus]
MESNIIINYLQYTILFYSALLYHHHHHHHPEPRVPAAPPATQYREVTKTYHSEQPVMTQWISTRMSGLQQQTSFPRENYRHVIPMICLDTINDNIPPLHSSPVRDLGFVTGLYCLKFSSA